MLLVDAEGNMTAMRPLEVGRGVFPPHIFGLLFVQKYMYVYR